MMPENDFIYKENSAAGGKGVECLAKRWFRPAKKFINEERSRRGNLLLLSYLNVIE
jgi:hypothetical protein